MSVPADTEAICARAREFVRKRKFAEAIEVYEQALQVDDRDIRAREGIATAAFLANDFDRAEEHFKRLSVIDVRRADPLVNLGAVYNRKGDYNSAVKALRQALAKNRKCAEAYYNLGIAHKGQNQISMAISAYKEAIRLAPNMAEAHQNLGNAFVEMGNFQQATNAFRRALEINPQFERAQRGLEAAQRMSQQAGVQANPFGRLVDVKQIATHASTEKKGPTLRALTDEERSEERNFIHNVATRFEQQGKEALEVIRQRLDPALLGLFNAVSQSEEKRRLLAANDALVDALEKYHRSIRPLHTSADDLQAHEDRLKRQLQES